MTEGEIHRVCAKALDIDNGKSKWLLFHSVLIYSSAQTAGSRYLSLRLPAQILYAGIHLCPLAVNRSCFGIRLALADGSGLPFSLHPPLAALESQTPQREPRFALNMPCRAPKQSTQKARCEAGFLCAGLFLFFFDSLEQDVLGIGDGICHAAFLKRNVQVRRCYRRISPPPKAGVI